MFDNFPSGIRTIIEQNFSDIERTILNNELSDELSAKIIKGGIENIFSSITEKYSASNLMLIIQIKKELKN